MERASFYFFFFLFPSPLPSHPHQPLPITVLPCTIPPQNVAALLFHEQCVVL